VEEHYDDDVALDCVLDDPTVMALLNAHFSNVSSAAVERLNELTEERRGTSRG
jgi:hypothetical protein